MELTKEIIMSSLKGELIKLCKENDINYTKKTKTELQELLLETIVESNLTEQYHYIPTKGEVLIMDTPSEPLKKEVVKKEIKRNPKKVKKEVETKPKSPFKKKVIENPVAIDLNSNKSIYANYLAHNKNYKLYYSGVVVFDSSVNKADIVFEEEYFSINERQFDYKNLKFKFA